jgi:RNA polymerase sigma-70 factor, ECF subfamily
MVDNTRAEPTPELIARARGGDERAFAELVTPYRVPLFALLLRELRDRSDAEDVMQEVLFLSWRGLRGYEHRGRFGAWLFTIAYRALTSHKRSPVRSWPGSDDAAPEPVSSATPESELEAAELGDALANTLGSLPEKQRRVFLLRQSAGLTFAEIAELLHEPLNTVLSHMNYAMQKIRRSLERHA